MRWNCIKIEKLVTDRHVQVAAYMANEKPAIKHAYDVWHVAKGMMNKQTLENDFFYRMVYTVMITIHQICFIGEKKKLTKVAKTKKFKSLKPWIGVNKKYVPNYPYLLVCQIS